MGTARPPPQGSTKFIVATDVHIIIYTYINICVYMYMCGYICVHRMIYISISICTPSPAILF